MSDNLYYDLKKVECDHLFFYYFLQFYKEQQFTENSIWDDVT